jgi:hypothetical protein
MAAACAGLALAFTMEPVFAALFGITLAGDARHDQRAPDRPPVRDAELAARQGDDAEART